VRSTTCHVGCRIIRAGRPSLRSENFAGGMKIWPGQRIEKCRISWHKSVSIDSRHDLTMKVDNSMRYHDVFEMSRRRRLQSIQVITPDQLGASTNLQTSFPTAAPQEDPRPTTMFVCPGRGGNGSNSTAESTQLTTVLQYAYIVDMLHANTTIEAPESFYERTVPELVSEATVEMMAVSLCQPLASTTNRDTNNVTMSNDTESFYFEEEDVDRFDDTTSPSSAPAFVSEMVTAGNVTTDIFAADTTRADSNEMPGDTELLNSDSSSSGLNGLRHHRDLRRLQVNATVDSSCIVSVSSGSADQYTQNCTSDATSLGGVDEACGLYAGTLKIVHLPACDRPAIRQLTISALGSGYASSTFVDPINLDPEVSAQLVVVQSVSLYEPEQGTVTVGAVQAITSENKSGPSAGGITMIVLLALIVLCLTLMYFIQRRRRKRGSDNDQKSLQTDWSNKGGDRSYLQANYRDLAGNHSGMDVHQCKSAFCHVCRPNLGVVHIESVPPGTKARRNGANDEEYLHSLSSTSKVDKAVASNGFSTAGSNNSPYLNDDGFELNKAVEKEQESIEGGLMANTSSRVDHSRTDVLPLTPDRAGRRWFGRKSKTPGEATTDMDGLERTFETSESDPITPPRSAEAPARFILTPDRSVGSYDETPAVIRSRSEQSSNSFFARRVTSRPDTLTFEPEKAVTL
jgi:hypothetical protein